MVFSVFSSVLGMRSTLLNFTDDIKSVLRRTGNIRENLKDRKTRNNRKQ